LKTGEVIHNRDSEERRHRQAIQSLAESMGLPLNKVSELYERELMILNRTARIKIYLSILVSRKVRDAFRAF